MAKGQGKGGVTTDGNVFFFEGKVMRIFRNEVVMMVMPGESHGQRSLVGYGP